MRRTVGDVAGSVGLTVWALGLLALIVGGVFAINAVVYPWWLRVQREGVEQSKSYNDSRNQMLFTYKDQYADLEVKIVDVNGNKDAVAAYRGQEKAILGSMCQLVGTMKTGTIAPDISAFLVEHGGCR